MAEESKGIFRGGVHNCVITRPQDLKDVSEHLYAAVIESEFTYDFPIDAPTYAQLYFYVPDEIDEQESIEANE